MSLSGICAILSGQDMGGSSSKPDRVFNVEKVNNQSLKIIHMEFIDEHQLVTILFHAGGLRKKSNFSKRNSNREW